MLQPTLRQYVFAHRFVEAVTWQPLRQALALRPLARVRQSEASSWEHAPRRAA
jgi:hypothetical protein